MSSFTRHFAIRRCDPWLIDELKLHWGYFFRNPENIKITIRKNNIFIHMKDDCAYSVILNFLLWMKNKNRLQCTKKDLQWLNTFDF